MGRTKLPPRRVIHKRHSGSKPARIVLGADRGPPCDVFQSSAEVRAEVLRILPETKAKPHTHLLLAPGNPGVIEYYRPLLRKLHARIPSDIRAHFSLHALGLPGHDLRHLNGQSTFAIHDHVALYQDYVRQISEPDDGFIFMGHSYGSFLLLRLMDELGAHFLANTHFVMLMPCLWHMKYCCGPLLRVLARDSFGLTSSTSWLATAFIPPILRNSLLELVQHDPSIIDVSRTVLDGQRRALYANVTTLARDEMKRITEVQSSHSAKSLLVWVDQDQWCPVEAKQRICEHFSERLEVEKLDNVTHAFVLKDFETDRVVRSVAPWICSRLFESLKTQSNGIISR
ncbi:Lipid droplet-associated hydrolase [Gracilaria domingensis]|nr:Lipid droplet-associated hydrolase [Gracilaria domingensis]